MNNLIITTRQSPVRLLVDYVATTILWTLFALFIFLFAIDLLTGYFWQSEARSRLQFYFLLAVVNAVVLIVWALYNKLRFQKQQHHAAYQYTPQEYAESLAIPDELYQQLQKSHRMSVHFTSQGQIKMVVSEKTLVPGINTQNKARFARLCTDNTLNCMHVAYVGKVPNVRNPLYRIGRSRPFHPLRNVPARHLIRSARREANRIA